MARDYAGIPAAAEFLNRQIPIAYWDDKTGVFNQSKAEADARLRLGGQYGTPYQRGERSTAANQKYLETVKGNVDRAVRSVDAILPIRRPSHMAIARSLKPAQVHDQDVITPEELLELAALRRAAHKDGKLPRRVAKRLRDAGLSVEQATLYSKLLFTDALMAQDRAIAFMWESKDPSILRMSLQAAIDAKDRYMGKPTEKIQVAQAVRVEVHGLDLSRLPEAPATREDVIDVNSQEHQERKRDD